MGSLFKPDVQDTTTTNTIAPWLEDYGKWATGAIPGMIDQPYQAYEGNRWAGFDPMQLAAQGTAGMYGNMAPGALGGAYNAYTDMTGAGMMGNAYSGLGNFMNQLGQNRDVRAQQSNAYTADAALADRNQIQNVDGGSFLGMDRDAYTNQYTEGVMDNVLSDLDRSWQQQNQALGSQANAAGAFGGSRHGVQGALAAGEANRNAGQMSNQLYNQAFDAASGLMSQDLNRGLQADMANQGMDWNAQNLNANLGTQTNQFNAGAKNTNSMFNAQQANQVGLQNAMNNLTGQGYGLQALQSMGSLGNLMGNFTQMQGQNLQGFGEQGMAAQSSAGAERQGLGQAQLNQQYEDFINERDWTRNLFTQLMPLGFGAQGSSTQTGQQFGPSKFSQLAGGAAAASGFFPGKPG